MKKARLAAAAALLSLCLGAAAADDRAPQEKDMGAYLMVYHKDADHGLHMALSYDGYKFKALNGDKPVIAGDTIAEQKGIRDPHIFRGPDGAFYLSMTDLHVFARQKGLRDTEWQRDGKQFGWGNNRALVLMKSRDLINWSRANIRIDQLSPQLADIGCAWAPATAYDYDKQKLMVFFTMRHRTQKCKLYYCYVNGDDMNVVRGTDLPVDPAKQNLENTAATAIKLAGVPLYLGAAAAILGFFLLDHPLNFTHVICAIVAALVYRFAVKSFINSELKKVHDNSDAIRRALLIQREVQDGRLSPDSEEAAQATTIPERVTHRISTMAVPTIIAAVFVVGLTLFASLQARFSSPAGAPTSTAAVQQSRSAETPRRQPAAEPSAPAQAPAPTARQEVQDPFVESLQMFDLLILQSKISNDPSVVAGVLNQIQSLAKPPVGNPQEAARHMKKVEDLFAKQDFGNAAALLSELARISPADGVLRGNLAYAYYKIKMYPEAIAQSAVALICNPTHENGWKVLQAACRQQNQARCVANSGLIISLLKGQ